MRQIINLGVLATLIVVAIALTSLIVDQSPTQIQGEGNPPMVSVDTWTSEVALFQDGEGDQGDGEGDQGDGEGEQGDEDCLGVGATCFIGLFECCPDLTCVETGIITSNFLTLTYTPGRREGVCTPDVDAFD